MEFGEHLLGNQMLPVLLSCSIINMPRCVCVCVCVCVFSDHSTWVACSWSQICVLAVCREPPSAPPTSVWLQERSSLETTRPTHRQQGEPVCLSVCLSVCLLTDCEQLSHITCVVLIRSLIHDWISHQTSSTCYDGSSEQFTKSPVLFYQLIIYSN